MGLSRCAMYLKDATEFLARDFLVDLGFLSAGSVSSGLVESQESIGEGQFGIAQAGDWTVIFSDSEPYFDGLDDEVLEKLSGQSEVFFWLTQSASGGMWFESWKHGSLQRKWVEVEGEVQEHFGAELPEEPRGYFDSTSPEGGRNEWSLAELAGKRTGIGTDRLFEMPFNLYVA